MRDIIVIPIRPKKSSWGLRKRFIPIRGNLFNKASRVMIDSNFPLQPGYAITVDKAQGQTIKRVILALSRRSNRLCQFDHASLYVALSRVKKRRI